MSLRRKDGNRDRLLINKRGPFVTPLLPTVKSMGKE